MPRKEAFRPRSALLVTIPVETGHEFQPLRILKSNAVNIGNEHQQRDNALAAARQPELVGLFEGVDHVAAAIGERHNLGARRLRLQQVGTEVGRVQRMADATEHLSAGGEHRVRSIGFE